MQVAFPVPVTLFEWDVSNSPTSMKPKRTILCIDSNEQSLSIRKILLETRGYRVAAYKNGQEALERFRMGDVDLVLTDLAITGTDGAKIIETVKALSPSTPAILLSDKARTYDHGTRADLFLAKNMCAPAELLERIRALLVRKRGPKRAQSPAAPSTHIGAA
jgi:two-component system, OmpR family, response regulator CpxR